MLRPSGGLSMTARSYRITLAVCVTALAVGVLTICVRYLQSQFKSSDIVDFHATNFVAKAETPFFYSIGDDLKRSDEIDPQAPTLLHGPITDFLVSPDSMKMAVVVDHQLVIVGTKISEVRKVGPADSIYRDRPPIGLHFIRDDNFQWSKDSKYLYFIKDEFYHSNGSQLFSEKGQLWRYDLLSGSIQLILQPFPAFNYFFGREGGIYFSAPTYEGDMQLEYFDGKDVKHVGPPNGVIQLDHLAASGPEAPFFSFSIIDYQHSVLPVKHVTLNINRERKIEDLEIGDRVYLP
jgi:hypothetical protein